MSSIVISQCLVKIVFNVYIIITLQVFSLLCQTVFHEYFLIFVLFPWSLELLFCCCCSFLCFYHCLSPNSCKWARKSFQRVFPHSPPHRMMHQCTALSGPAAVTLLLSLDQWLVRLNVQASPSIYFHPSPMLDPLFLTLLFPFSWFIVCLVHHISKNSLRKDCGHRGKGSGILWHMFRCLHSWSWAS